MNQPPTPGTQLPVEQQIEGADGAAVTLGSLIGPEGLFCAVIKTECPTCELLSPHLDRLAAHHGRTDLPVVIVSQNTREEVTAYAERLNLTWPILLDDRPHALSAALDLRAVPTCLRMDERGVLIRLQEGFSRAFLEELDGELASIAGQTPSGLFDGTDVPALRPG